MFILIRLTQHVSGIVMPIIRRTDYVNNCMWSMPGCVGCNRAELGHELCAPCGGWYRVGTRAVCTVCLNHYATSGPQMPQVQMLILIRLTQHVSGIIMPIVRRTDYVNNCMWSMSGCVGCSRAELGH